MNDTQSLFVERDYVMSPEDDDLLFSGTDLKEGMVVLIESSSMKGGPEDLNTTYAKKRYLEANRWCTVLRVEIRERVDRDQNGRTIPISPLVSFLAEYPDGTKTKRSYDASYAWYVKKFSLPAENES